MNENLNDMANEYAVSLQKSKKSVQKPKMPKHDISAYTDYEYMSALSELYATLHDLDSLEISEKFLKGE